MEEKEDKQKTKTILIRKSSVFGLSENFTQLLETSRDVAVVVGTEREKNFS